MNDYLSALDAVTDLLTRLRLAHAFVGGVARAAWLGCPIGQGAVDVVALLTPEQKSQVAMMASHRGFRVDRDEVERTAGLDLVPLHFETAVGEIRVHVLVGSNALYGHMVRAASPAEVEGRTLPVVTREHLALLLSFAEDEQSLQDRDELMRAPAFDREAFDRLATTIGAAGVVDR
ncbi:MAG TPA: hypothetical protein VFL80_06275 [Thermoanaerobaculia bacterium]|nr:hypothetical protein [Thermoanaerobaculia bacterium]